MAKQQIENAIRNIEVERDQKLRAVEQRVYQEKIAPYNADIDKQRDESMSKLQSDFNADIQKRQEKFNADKATIIAACEANKKNHAEVEIACAQKEIRDSYKAIIEILNKTANDIVE